MDTRIYNFSRPNTGLPESLEEKNKDIELETTSELNSALIPAELLPNIEITPRENIIGSWFRQGDLGFIFGQRGLGKTWLALYLSRRIAEGQPCGPWTCPKARPVLYIDGEMPLDAMKERDNKIKEKPANLYYLTHEYFFDKCGKILNLSDSIMQKAILNITDSRNIELIVIDNLSCLFTGIAENDADDWEQVLPWLLQLRRQRVAVIIVHHANRGGREMRGTSRREDAAFWVIRLDTPTTSIIQNVEGANFITSFTKNRQGSEEETQCLDWNFIPKGDIKTKITFQPISKLDIFKQCVIDGLSSCTDIAIDMGISKGMISRLAKKGVQERWLEIRGREYFIKKP